MAAKFKLDDLKKVESSTVRSLAQSGREMLQGIIKVTEANYIPRNVRVRATIDPHLLTGDFERCELETLEKDPRVESVSINKTLQSPK